MTTATELLKYMTLYKNCWLESQEYLLITNQASFETWLDFSMYKYEFEHTYICEQVILPAL